MTTTICKSCEKPTSGNPYFVTEAGVLCYSCKGKARKAKKKTKPRKTKKPAVG